MALDAVAMARFPRIRPYKTFAIAKGGKRIAISAHELALERPAGVDLEINLAPHPNFRGRVSFATYRGSSLLLEAASSGDAYVFIEDWPVGDRRRKLVRNNARGPLVHVYLVDARGEKRVTAARSFAIRTSPDHELLVELCPAAPWARHVRIESSSGLLAIHLNAANTVFFSADG
jgi:hypothetical protein